MTDVKEHLEEIKIYLRGHNLFDLFYGRYKDQEAELLDRYQFIQKYKKESRQFGAQRRASEGRAADMALQNLSTNAGFSDVTRLMLRMESRLTASYEEFFTEVETVDSNRFKALGVVIGKNIPNKQKVVSLFERLNDLFNKDKTTKEEVIAIMKDYLPNFEHIETGKSLDSKM